jgi:hypothetical protein
MKRRFDAELDEEVELEQSQIATVATGGSSPSAHDPTPDFDADPSNGSTYYEDRSAATVGRILHASGKRRKSLLGRTRRFSTLERTSIFEDTAGQTSWLLKVWIILGVLQAAAAVAVPYASQLRFVLLLLACLPSSTAAPATHRVFSSTVVPLMARAQPFVQSCVVAVQDAVSPPLRRAASVAVLWASPYAPTEELLVTERALSHEQAMLATTRKSRRVAALKEASGGGAGRGADFYDDNELRSGSPAPSTSPVRPSAAVIPGRLSDLWGLLSPQAAVAPRSRLMEAVGSSPDARRRRHTSASLPPIARAGDW